MTIIDTNKMSTESVFFVTKDVFASISRVITEVCALAHFSFELSIWRGDTALYQVHGEYDQEEDK